MTNEILTVHEVTYDWGSCAVRCPHCKELIYVEGDHIDVIHLLQDLSRELTNWFASKPDARMRVREACQLIKESHEQAAVS